MDVQETEDVARSWSDRAAFTFPVLLDPDGSVTATYAPDGVLPDLPRETVPIASNLVIDRDGRIRFYSLLDSKAFDAKLVQVKGLLDEMLAAEAAPAE